MMVLGIRMNTTTRLARSVKLVRTIKMLLPILNKTSSRSFFLTLLAPDVVQEVIVVSSTPPKPKSERKKRYVMSGRANFNLSNIPCFFHF